MKLNRFWLAGALSLAFTSFAYAGPKPQYVPGQVLVKFKPHAAATRNTAHQAVGAVPISEIDVLGVQTLRLPANMSVEKAIAYYKRLSGVEYVEPNYIRKAFYVPNDPRYNEQYTMPRLKMPQAWDMHFGASATKIAIIDTGVDYNHPDLKGKTILGRDFAANDNDPMDEDGHGTHVAGIAAASTNNGIGIAGVGFNCSIIAIRVLGPHGGASEWIANGIRYAADNGASVINLSLGGPGEALVERDAVRYASNKGCVIIAAAGNDGTTNRGYPAANPLTIAVAATDSNDKKADFSTYGADWVDVAAPGVDLMSTLPNNTYGNNSGTSMASPVVAGLAGLMRAYAPDATAAEIRAVIESTTDNVGPFISKGRVNGFAAMSAIIKPVETALPVSGVGIYTLNGQLQGTNATGSAANLAANDGLTYSVDSVRVSQLGSASAPAVSFFFSPDENKLKTLKLSFTSASHRNATNSIYLWNYDRNRYDLLRSFAGSDTMRTQTFEVKNLPKAYVNGTQVQFVVRAVVNQRGRVAPPAFRFALDSVKLTSVTLP